MPYLTPVVKQTGKTLLGAFAKLHPFIQLLLVLFALILFLGPHIPIPKPPNIPNLTRVKCPKCGQHYQVNIGHVCPKQLF